MKVPTRTLLFISLVATFMLVLAAPALGFSATEGQQFSGAVGSVFLACPATGPETFDCSTMPQTRSGAMINWGDGVTDGTSANRVSCESSGGTCVYSVTGTHIYSEEGSYSVSFTVPNPNGPPSNNPAHGTVTATVADAALTNPTGLSPAATEGVIGLFDLINFADANPGATPADFTATINWGDGTSSAGTVTTGPGGTFEVGQYHAFAEEGTASVQVSVSDDGGSTTLATAHVNVADAPLTNPTGAGLSATEGTAAPFNLGSFKDTDPTASASDFTATIDWGDGSGSTPATVSANGTGMFDVGAAHTFAEEGAFAPTVTVTDVGGQSTTFTAHVAVSDAALSIESVDLSPNAGGTVSGTVATFTDGDPGGVVSDYSATIHWGDGTPSDAGSITPAGRGGFAVDGDHRYAHAGRFTVTMTVSDRGRASASTQDVVIIGPKAPSTKISKVKLDRQKDSAEFTFKAVGGGKGNATTRFECALLKKKDAKAKFKTCASPKKYKHLKPHRYIFEVRALDAAGADPTPAVKRFQIRP